jgi:hypothetical protein
LRFVYQSDSVIFTEAGTMSDENVPKRSPIRFNINASGEPSELDEFVSQIQTIAEQYLYHWDSFPFGESRRNAIYR